MGTGVRLDKRKRRKEGGGGVNSLREEKKRRMEKRRRIDMDACLMRSKNMYGEGWIGEEILWGMIMDVKKIQRNRMKKAVGGGGGGGGGALAREI